MVPLAICIPMLLVQTPGIIKEILLVPFAIFFCCDFLFVVSDKTKRTAKECLENIQGMQSLMSYYIPTAAVILTFSDGSVLREINREDPTAIVLMAIGVVASAVAMVWIPIPRYNKDLNLKGGPTNELKTIYLIVCFMEKVAIIFVLAGLFLFCRAILDMEDDNILIHLKCTDSSCYIKSTSLNCNVEEDMYESISLKCFKD